MTAPHNKRSPHGRRAMANYMHLGRTAMESHYRMAVDNLPQGEPYPSLGNFDTKQAWAWIKTGLRRPTRPTSNRFSFRRIDGTRLIRIRPPENRVTTT